MRGSTISSGEPIANVEKILWFVGNKNQQAFAEGEERADRGSMFLRTEDTICKSDK